MVVADLISYLYEFDLDQPCSIELPTGELVNVTEVTEDWEIEVKTKTSSIKSRVILR